MPGRQTVIAHDSRYLHLATGLLQRMRLASATGGVWEAADVQWWSRQERATDADGQVFWLDEAGEPEAAVIATDFGATTQCDVLVSAAGDATADNAWARALEKAEALRQCGVAVELPLPADSTAGARVLAGAGYQPTGEEIIASWLDAVRTPPVTPLAAGYRLRSWADNPARSHPLVPRNGADVAARLARCSLYRPDLDLRVEAPDGEVAGYGLFWADPVTRVGLVEPMRTEENHQRRGIARHILTSGLGRLAAAGCTRLKVSSDIDLYLSAGFSPVTVATIYAPPA
jgi:GNAT superfamily N-acetyltransferase